MAPRDSLIQLRSERLALIPLSLEQMRLLLRGTECLEEALGLAPSGCTMDTEMREAMHALYERACKEPENILWLTNWQIIERSANVSIGAACFTGAPNEEREVELGYTLYHAFRGMGYMTEAILCIADWALDQAGVSSVLAKTDKENMASKGVLRRSGFAQFYQNEAYDFWKKERASPSSARPSP